jgi:hypothetical protein
MRNILVSFDVPAGVYLCGKPVEHIANIEQIVYSAVLALPGRGRFVAGLPNPGHKEHGS